MQLQTKGLLSELQWATRFTDTSKRPALPVLSHVLFTVSGKRLTLTGTDLAVAGITTVDGDGRGAWSVAVPVARLIKYLQKVDEPVVTLGAEQGGTVLTVSHGGDGTKVTGMAIDIFPDLPAAPAPRATIYGLPETINRVLFAVSTEETRFTLNGALLEAEDGTARLIGTDGHRLSIAPLQIKGDGKFRALIHKDALAEAAKLDGDCTFASNEDFLFLNWGQRRIIARKLAGNFPDWQRVMVGAPEHHVMVPVESALKTLDRVAVYADAKSHTVRFTVADSALTINAKSTEGEGQGSVPVIAGKGDGPFTTGFSATYVSEFLSKVKAHPYVAFCWQADEVTAEGKVKPNGAGAAKAVVFTTGDRWSYVLMPMRLS